MKYLCLVYQEEGMQESLHDSNCLAFDESIRQSSHYLASEALQPVQTATTVRVRDGDFMKSWLPLVCCLMHPVCNLVLKDGEFSTAEISLC